MKKLILLLITLLPLSLTSCSPKKEEPVNPPIHEHTFSSEWSYDENYHWHDSTCGHEVVSEYGSHTFKDNVCITCGYEKEEEIPPVPPVSETYTLDIYATNDIHGQIEENNNRMDIATIGTFLKERSNEDNTLLLDQGDSWQGSIYSNYNRGALVNDVMCEARYDARTVGNHDFDWGVEPLVNNTSRSYNDYTIPVLAANVYDYDFINKKVGTTQLEEIGQKTVTYTLENGLKVGIVGVIGSPQITSISSNYVMDVAFIDHIKVIKEEATKLREDGCDFVIASIHAGQEEVMNQDIEQYVDLVLCGHSHRYETYKDSATGVYYAQFGSYNQYIGHLHFEFNEEKQLTSTVVDALNKRRVETQVDKIDEEITKIVNKYKSECDEEANVIVASNAEYFSRYDTAVNLMCEAMLDASFKAGYEDVILSYCNVSRNNLNSGTWTYADLYQSFPFDNEVYIVDIKGSDVLNEIKTNNNLCYSSTFIDKGIDRNKTYRIAVIDYLLFHTNEARYYNYFRSFNGEYVAKLDDNYRIILKNYLIDNGYSSGKRLSSSNYSNSIDKFNSELLYEI